MRISLANQITLSRLVLAAVFLVLLAMVDATRIDAQRTLIQICFWLFVVAALTDALDGIVARMTNTVTSFGRIVDPLVDKIIVGGAFVLLASHTFWDGEQNITGVAPWMVVVILTRELLVSGVRAQSESSGAAFAASWSGKIKMILQCVTIAVILGELAWNLTAIAPLRIFLIWATVVVTIISGVTYILRGRAFLLTNEALSGTSKSSESEARR